MRVATVGTAPVGLIRDDDRQNDRLRSPRNPLDRDSVSFQNLNMTFSFRRRFYLLPRDQSLSMAVACRRGWRDLLVHRERRFGYNKRNKRDTGIRTVARSIEFTLRWMACWIVRAGSPTTKSARSPIKDPRGR